MTEVKNNVIASFDVTTVEGQMKVFNAQNGASISLKTLEDGTVFECEGALQYTEVIDTYGEAKEGTISVLFATDGTSYAGVSETVAQATEKLIGFFGQSKLDKIKVKVVKQKSGKGNEFLNLQLVG